MISRRSLIKGTIGTGLAIAGGVVPSLPQPVAADDAPLTMRQVGDKLGFVIGTTVDGAEDYWKPEYQKAVSDHFSLIFPSGSFVQATFEKPKIGTQLATAFRNWADRNNQSLYIHPGFWHQDVSPSIKDASNDDVAVFMRNRVATLLGWLCPETSVI